MPSRCGISPADIRRATETYLGGKVVGEVYEDQKVFKVVVRGAPGMTSVEALRELLVVVPSGAAIPLRDLAEVSITLPAVR